MSERPIIFSGESVRAILAGRKTQTRRVVRGFPLDGHVQPLRDGAWEHSPDGGFDWNVVSAACPFGRPGDRLWVREEFSGPYLYHAQRKPPRAWSPTAPIHYWADGSPWSGDWTPPRPAMFMPRWASRITLEVVSVRVERLQAITEADARAEGVEPNVYNMGAALVYLHSFRRTWDALNAKRRHGWDENPWVWVVGFKRTEDER